MLSLSSARELVVTSIQEAQKSYKSQYEKRTNTVNFRLGDWVFVRFPEEETGKKRKLSRPWYGWLPDMTLIRRYISPRTHRSQFISYEYVSVLTCCRTFSAAPTELHHILVHSAPPPGFYWYRAKRRRTPTRLQCMLNAATPDDTFRPNTRGPQEEDSHSEDSGRPTSPGVPRSQSPEPVSGDSPAEDVCEDVSNTQGPTDLSHEGPREDVESVVADHWQGSEDVVQRHNLQDLSVLPYAVDDHIPTTPPRYSLRDRSRRQQPRRLMQVNSSG